MVPGISLLSSFFCKEWKANRASGPPPLAPALLLEFTHSQGSSTSCLPFFTPCSRNPIWVKRLGLESDSKRRSRLQRAWFPPLHSSQVSLWNTDINSLLPTFWTGAQSDITRAMLEESPTTIFLQESLHKSWEGRALEQLSFLLVSCIILLQTLLSYFVWSRYKSNKAKSIVH